MDYFKHDFPLALPPYSTTERTIFNYKPDSFFVIGKTVGVLRLIIPEKGFYHIVTDKDTKNGLTLYSVDASFPGIKDETEMIKCIRYITTSEEYNALMNSNHKKAAIDEFWKEKGGSNERAKELLRKYYLRVQQSNKLFTSFQSGWQTDRGMIYIIYGSPGTIYRSAESESWTYGTPNSSLSLNFFFIKVNNPFSENDFTLSRSPSYESTWYRAVEVWRQGRAYNSFN